MAAAVEIEPYACATYKANHPKVQLLEKDIKEVPGKDPLDIAGVCNVVGNALPCDFAAVVSQECHDALDRPDSMQ